MKNAVVKREAAPAVVQGGKVDFTEVIVEGGGLADGHAAERVRLHLAAALELGRRSIAHAVAAGWELACQKALLGYGGWGRWCRQELGFSQDTADRYIELFRKTVGAARAVAGIAEESTLTRDEVEKATVAVDAATVTGAMIELNIVKRNGKWGGVREGSGRKPKGSPEEVEAALDAAANYEPAMWASAEGAIGTLLGLDRDKDFLRRLTDEHLAVAARSLADLSKKAGELLSARLARRDMGLHGEEMKTSEVLKVLERGL